MFVNGRNGKIPKLLRSRKRILVTSQLDAHEAIKTFTPSAVLSTAFTLILNFSPAIHEPRSSTQLALPNRAIDFGQSLGVPVIHKHA